MTIEPSYLEFYSIRVVSAYHNSQTPVLSPACWSEPKVHAFKWGQMFDKTS